LACVPSLCPFQSLRSSRSLIRCATVHTEQRALMVGAGLLPGSFSCRCASSESSTLVQAGDALKLAFGVTIVAAGGRDVEAWNLAHALVSQ
jgi:hypothetical protein